jgi:hypothetical protein
MIYVNVVNYLPLKYLKPDVLIHKCLLPTSLLGFIAPQRNEISSLIMATYSQLTWEKHKATITQLYAVKTLQQVMDDMKERHGFTAT